MKEVINKWETILNKDKENNITYGRIVIEEMLNDFKKAVEKNSNNNVKITTDKLKNVLEQVICSTIVNMGDKQFDLSVKENRDKYINEYVCNTLKMM